MFNLQMINIVMLIICAFAGTVWPYLYLHFPLIVFQILAQSILLFYCISLSIYFVQQPVSISWDMCSDWK